MGNITVSNHSGNNWKIPLASLKSSHTTIISGVISSHWPIPDSFCPGKFECTNYAASSQLPPRTLPPVHHRLDYSTRGPAEHAWGCMKNKVPNSNTLCLWSFNGKPKLGAKLRTYLYISKYRRGKGFSRDLEEPLRPVSHLLPTLRLPKPKRLSFLF